MLIKTLLFFYSIALASIPICDSQGFDFANMTPLGKGGQGAAMIVKSKDGKKPFVLKQYNKIRDYQRELRSLRKIRHPNVIEILCRRPDELGLVIPLMSDGDLGRIQYGTSMQRIQFYVAQLIRATHAIHRNGYVHCDIKPANLVRHGDHIFLIDFGLAMRLDKINGRAGTRTTMSPEMAFRQGPLTEAVDWWSVGATIWMMSANALIPESERNRRNMTPYRLEKDIESNEYVSLEEHDFPPQFDSFPALIDLIQVLMPRNPQNRRFRDIRLLQEHPFFESLDWSVFE